MGEGGQSRERMGTPAIMSTFFNVLNLKINKSSVPNKINKTRLSGWNLPAFRLGMKSVFTVLPMVWVELFGSSSENDLTPADKQEHRQPKSRNRRRCRLDLLPLEQKNNRGADWRQATRVFLILLAVSLPSHTYYCS